MAFVEYITTKLYKQTKELILYVQAQEQLKRGERLSEAEILDMLTKHYVEEKYGNIKKSKYQFSDLFAGVKGGRKSSPEEIDKVVYGL